jgi:hypothetical protein
VNYTYPHIIQTRIKRKNVLQWQIRFDPWVVNFDGIYLSDKFFEEENFVWIHNSDHYRLASIQRVKNRWVYIADPHLSVIRRKVSNGETVTLLAQDWFLGAHLMFSRGHMDIVKFIQRCCLFNGELWKPADLPIGVSIYNKKR